MIKIAGGIFIKAAAPGMRRAAFDVGRSAAASGRTMPKRTPAPPPPAQPKTAPPAAAPAAPARQNAWDTNDINVSNFPGIEFAESPKQYMQTAGTQQAPTRLAQAGQSGQVTRPAASSGRLTPEQRMKVQQGGARGGLSGIWNTLNTPISELLNG